MGVPGTVDGFILIPENGNKCAAGFNKTACGKTSLSKEAHAVAFPGL